MLKVLHIITQLVLGGAQDNTLITIAKHDRSKFHVHLASAPHGLWLERSKKVADVFYPISHLVNPISPLQDIIALIEIIRLLRREKFDIIHTHSSKAGILGRWAGRLAGIPVIVHTVHGFSFHDFMPTWKKQLYIFLERISRSCGDFYITVSELNRQEAVQLKFFKLDNSITIYSGIDFKKLDREVDLTLVKHQIGIPDKWQTIVSVGRLDAQKAPHFLIDAFAQVLSYYPETVLLLVGDGELRQELEAQVNRLNITSKVYFLGSREDVPEILKIADIFALSSLWEGLGRAMTEAMLVGKPVVVPAIYGIPEIVHHQETGLLFEAKNVEQLATHLVYLLQHPEERDRLGQNAKNLTRKLFDGDAMVRQIEEVYEKLLQEKIH
ncbi:glycosyltransferase family 4 protein [Nostoc sp. UHCC 0870]|uniref:glycosyltransferase family 4 protein n=1 Tax=Nostoc sp. UHCC 0870 TaxID=2914041 RepID=UPI001EE0B7CA|nr:glycosyltransferase family 4 protein [Nostoc sp. UHCC 0870]UKO98448.1 glycosyltransferase family 4 protein [Nostoc sp. UHCC 0870]